MSSGFEMINDLEGLCNTLATAIHDMAKRGKEYAEAEARYKVALMQVSLKLRDQDNLPVTLIDKVVHGYVADERRDRDIAEAFYKTAQENVNAIKLRIRILDNQISREWNNGDWVDKRRP